MWNEFEGNLARLIRHCYEKRELMYIDHIKAVLLTRGTPSWDISNFFFSKESFAMFFERARFLEEAYIEVQDLESTFIDCAESRDPNDLGAIEFGGFNEGDDACMILDSTVDPAFIRSAVKNKTATELLLRQYLFARQSQLLKRLGKYIAVLQRGISFVQTMASVLGARKDKLRPLFREVWIFCSCMALAEYAEEILESSNDLDSGSSDNVSVSRFRGDLLCFARVELTMIGEALGFGKTLNMSKEKGQNLVNIRKRGSAAMSSPSYSPFRRLTAALKHRQNSRGNHLKPKSLEEDLYNLEISSKVKANASDNFETKLSTKDHKTTEDAQLPTTDSKSDSLKSGTVVRVEDLSWISNPALLRSISNEEAFLETIGNLTMAAADSFRSCGRHRQAAHLDLEVADMYISQERYSTAAILLKQSLPVYRIENWDVIVFRIFLRLRSCFREMDDFERLASTCLTLLSMCEGRPQQQSLQFKLDLQDEVLIAAEKISQWTNVGVDDDSKCLISDPKVTRISRKFCLPHNTEAQRRTIQANDFVEFEIDLFSSFPKSLPLAGIKLQLRHVDLSSDSDYQEVLVDCTFAENPDKLESGSCVMVPGQNILVYSRATTSLPPSLPPSLLSLPLPVSPSRARGQIFSSFGLLCGHTTVRRGLPRVISYVDIYTCSRVPHGYVNGRAGGQTGVGEEDATTVTRCKEREEKRERECRYGNGTGVEE